MLEGHLEKIKRNSESEVTKMNKDMLDIIQYHITEKLLITIERSCIEKEVLRGFPLYVNSEILIMTKIYDFHDEGVVVINTFDISDAYSKESDNFIEKICKTEKLDRVDNPFPLCETMFDVLLTIDTNTQFITIQCEKEETELYYSIGKLQSVTPTAIMMNVFDVTGHWEEDVRTIPCDAVTMISIGDHYSRIYYKYMSFLM